MRCGSAKIEQLNREFKMSLKKASVAAPLSVAARSGADISGEASDMRGGFIIPLIAVVAVILGVLAAVGGSDRPSSP